MLAHFWRHSHEEVTTVEGLTAEIEGLERRLAESSSQQEQGESGEFLVRRLRESDTWSELAAKRAELDVLRQELRDSKGKTQPRLPVVSPTEGESKAPTLAEFRPDTASRETANPDPGSTGWMQAQSAYQTRSRTEIGRQALMSVATTGILALSAFAMLTAVGLPQQGPHAVAALGAAEMAACAAVGCTQSSALQIESTIAEATIASLKPLLNQGEPSIPETLSVPAVAASSEIANGLEDAAGSIVIQDEIDLDALNTTPIEGEAAVSDASAPSGMIFAPGFRGVNLRVEPSARAKSVQLVPVGSRVFVLEGKQRVGGELWQEIRTAEGLEGWVLARAVAR